MVSKDFHVVAETGIHARSATLLVQEANLLQILPLNTKVNQLTLNLSWVLWESWCYQGVRRYNHC